MGVYDQAARYAFRAEPHGVSRRLLRGVHLPLAFRELVDTRTTPLPGERDRVCDSVAAFDNTNHAEEPWLLVVEFQAEHDADKLDVTLVYVARLRADYRHGLPPGGRYKVAAALVYLQGQAPVSVVDMTLPGLGGVGTRHETLVWNVADEDAAVVLADVARDASTWGLLFWVPLMRGASEAGIMEQWLRLAARVPSSRWRADLGRVALVFANLAGCLQAWRQALQEWNMKESELVMEWTAEARAEAHKEGHQRGKEEGFREGMVEGMVEGIVKGKREALLHVLQIRFPGQLTLEITDALAQQHNPEELDKWFKTALTAPSIVAFQQALNFVNEQDR